MSVGISTTLTPEERVMRARIAAQTRWGRTSAEGRRTATEPARQAQLARFLMEVDRENPGLPQDERHKLAASKLSAHMLRLRLAGSKRRREGGDSG
jgi:hypothetical protein